MSLYRTAKGRHTTSFGTGYRPTELSAERLGRVTEFTKDALDHLSEVQPRGRSRGLHCVGVTRSGSVVVVHPPKP